MNTYSEVLVFGSFEDDDLSVEERLQLKRILYERKTSELELPWESPNSLTAKPREPIVSTIVNSCFAPAVDVCVVRTSGEQTSAEPVLPPAARCRHSAAGCEPPSDVSSSIQAVSSPSTHALMPPSAHAPQLLSTHALTPLCTHAPLGAGVSKSPVIVVTDVVNFSISSGFNNDGSRTSPGSQPDDTTTTPRTPSGPYNPSGPGTSSGPDTPSGPGTPSDPDTHSGPDARSDPGAPSDPGTPSGPVAPSGPGTHSGPDTHSGPGAPSGPDTPSGPEAPSGPVAPSVPDTPSGPASSSWAQLFRNTNMAANATVIFTPKTEVDEKPTPEADETTSAIKWHLATPPAPSVKVIKSEDDLKAVRRLAAAWRGLRLCHHCVRLQPRGLSNRANWCYINATLQALIACPPFYHLLRATPAITRSKVGQTSTPVTDALVEFVQRFKVLPGKVLDKSASATNKGAQRATVLPPGVVFEPTEVYRMLQVIKHEAAFKSGRQEDAEEFLGCLLDSLHEEMLATMRVADSVSGVGSDTAGLVNTNGSETGLVGSSSAAEEQDDWEQMGRHRRSMLTRSTDYCSSPISEIFRGQLRSIVRQKGARESATLQPFFTLQLDIQSDKVCSVQEALEGLMMKEELHGYISAKTKQQVEAWRHFSLESLPPVLVLHLKCFVYDQSGGCQKVTNKMIDLEAQLNISKDLLSTNVRSKWTQAKRCYKLFAVVSHHGVKAAGGHYTTCAQHAGGVWVRSDDSGVRTVTERQVLRCTPPTVPYLLYYSRQQ